MLIILSSLLILCLWGFRFTQMNPDYFSREETNAIKGIFAIIILCSHISSYVTTSDSLADRVPLWFLCYLGQTMVAPYLFYSGYGIYYSFQNKLDYARDFFRKRFLKTLIHFDLAIFLFIIVQAFFPIHYPTRNYLLCWIGWESIGNSNWFIFVILSLYLFAWLGLIAEEKKRHALLFIVTFLSGTLWVLLRFVAHKDNWWIDTLAAFPLGMVFRFLQERIEAHLRFELTHRWLIYTAVLVAIYLGWHHLKGVDNFGICSCLFCLVLTLITMKTRIGNPILSWLGKRAFAIYILQRLPMIILSRYDLYQIPALYIPVVILTTLLLAEGFTHFTDQLDSRLLHV